jgi:hypothetical protein
LDSNEHYFCERYHIPRIPCGDHPLVCVLYMSVPKLSSSCGRYHFSLNYMKVVFSSVCMIDFTYKLYQPLLHYLKTMPNSIFSLRVQSSYAPHILETPPCLKPHEMTGSVTVDGNWDTERGNRHTHNMYIWYTERVS